MKRISENSTSFDYEIETSDWRYNAAIVGLLKYFDFLDAIGKEKIEDLYFYEDNSDCMKFNSSKITAENYILFVEKFFADTMHHKIIENLLANEELTEDQMKQINEKLRANAIMKKIFGKLVFDGSNKEEILNVIEQNRLELIKETYKRAKNGYSNFLNENLLLSSENKICRVLNYCIDIGKKGKSLGYNWNLDSYVFQDDIIFDFIPFAFTKTYDAFFINNNITIKELVKTNRKIELTENPRSTLFSEMKNSSEYVDYDVEVIVKNRDKKFYETLFVRKQAINVFKKIDNYKNIQIVYREDEKNPKYLEVEIVNSILNGIKLDGMIEKLLKGKKRDYSYGIRVLIEINNLIYKGESKMNEKMKGAYAAAKSVKAAIEDNKVNSYKQKLISAITFKDYDRFCEILIQLAAYSKINMNFAYDLFDNFEENKNLAYTFINALNSDKKIEGKEGK